MNYKIIKTTLDEIKPIFQQYLETLHCVTDDYWEEHIAKADCYAIQFEERNIGCFTVFNNEKITHFYLFEEYLSMAQSIFKEILDQYQIKTAYVTTGDQLFLSLCLDFHSKIEMQAYFFDGTVMHTVRPPEYGRECFVKITPDELEEVNAKAGGFFDEFPKSSLEDNTVSIYRLVQDGEELGYGVIVPNKMQSKYWPVGMYTIETKRKSGVGRSIQMHLAEICRENGFIPISGCWYYNHLSKKTIESAGRYTKTRLLNVIF